MARLPHATEWLNVVDLEAACRREALGGLAPHPVQNLTQVRTLLKGWMVGVSDLVVRGGRDVIIVLALDGVGYGPFERACRPDVLIPLTSVFPSSSVPAWMSASTGLRVEEHSLPGFLCSWEDDELIDVVSGKRVAARTDLPPGERPDLVYGPWPTLFADAVATGTTPLVNPGALELWSGPWTRAVLSGATLVPSENDWDTVRHDPHLVAAAVVEEVEVLVSGRNPESPLLLWSYVDFDTYLHENGPTPEFDAALARLDSAARAWAASGCTVVVHSDHGVASTETDPRIDSQWNDINSKLCRLPPGGAGRVRWCYPSGGRKSDLIVALREAFGHAALVIRVEQLADYGLLSPNRTLLARMGEVLIIAMQREFPASNQRYAFEHGAVSAEEMLVPFAVWQPHS